MTQDVNQIMKDGAAMTENKVQGIPNKASKEIYCPFCGRMQLFRTRVFILHEEQVSDMEFDPNEEVSFHVKMRYDHQLGICRKCREKVTVAQIYKMVGD